MTELHWYFLFLFAWVFFQSLWLTKLSKQVVALQSELEELKGTKKR